MKLEWWASEVAVMSAGLLPDAERQLSAMAIYQNTNILLFMVPAGLSVACATRYCINFLLLIDCSDKSLCVHAKMLCQACIGSRTAAALAGDAALCCQQAKIAACLCASVCARSDSQG